MIQRIKTDGVAMVVSKCPPRAIMWLQRRTTSRLFFGLIQNHCVRCTFEKIGLNHGTLRVFKFSYLKNFLNLRDVDLSGALRCKDTGMVRASEHPRYRKYFRMLRSLPMQAVAKSMRLAGFDERILESPDELVMLEDDEEEKKPECLDDALSRTALSKASMSY